MLEIRPFTGTDKEYEERVFIANANWPEYKETVEEYRFAIENEPKEDWVKRYTLYFDGEAVGTGAYRRVKVPDRQDVYRLEVSILREYRRRGFANQFYEYGLAQLMNAEPTPTLLQCETREDQTDALAWIEKLGFKLVMRSPISHLDVQAFDPAPFAGLADKMEREEIEIATLESLRQSDEQAEYKLWDLIENHLVYDIPSPHGHVPRSFEEVKKRFFGHPEYRPDGNFIAIHKGEYVAMSGLWGRVDPDKMYVGLTGTKRDYRRKGIAIALKIYTIEFAKAQGIKIIETDNEENNPMFDINVKLGFEKRPAWVEFEKKVDEV